MSRVRRAVLTCALGLVLVPALPAVGADGGTTVLFTVGSPSGTVALLPVGSVVVSSTPGRAQTVTIASLVTDGRVAGGSWSDLVSGSDFTRVGARPMPASRATVTCSRPEVGAAGVATVTSRHDEGNPLRLSGHPQPLLSAVSTNASAAAFTATVTLDLRGQPAGTYAGTITQTVG